MSNAPSAPPHLSFEHEAMMTTFSLRLRGNDEAMLRSLACECFEIIDEHERKLSRYHEGGDVFRINRLKANETLHVSEECHQCLLVAMEAGVLTSGLFDPTLGTVIEHVKSGEQGAPPSLRGRLIVHPDTPAITCETPGRVIDLGGIGKGFTLDALGHFLTGWGLEGALLSSGASTHLAIGSGSWPINLTGEHHTLSVALEEEALSASGTSIQGCHIVHPHSDNARTSTQPVRIWARSRTAAMADAWSTALMLVPPMDLDTLPSDVNRLRSIYLEDDSGFKKFPMPSLH